MTEKSYETKFALLEKAQEIMSNEISEIKEIVKSFDSKLDKALEKKADIWVEKALSWVIYTILGAVLMALLYTVIKNNGKL